jgi:hypothetical protein
MEIKLISSREHTFNHGLKFIGILHRSLLCCVYTGFVFYGLKFDLNALKSHRIGLLLLLILQYILGIISLAYIANLIITK